MTQAIVAVCSVDEAIVEYARAKMKLRDHNQVVRESFTRQATAFAATPWISGEERIGRLISAANLKGHERVLDVAAGPGYITEAFARVAAKAVGVDLTEAMLQIARERVRARGLKNVSFRPGDAKSLPYSDEEFDVVVTRFSLHHFPDPREALREMARVCRADGRIVVEDILTSEHPGRAALHNEIEILRDPSHVRAMPLSDLLVLFPDAGLEPQSVLMCDDLAPELEQWLATTETPPEKAERIRNFFQAEMARDRGGLRPYQDATGKLHFRLRTAIITGQKFRG